MGLGLEKEKHYCQSKKDLDQRDVFIGLHSLPECQRRLQVQIRLERNEWCRSKNPIYSSSFLKKYKTHPPNECIPGQSSYLPLTFSLRGSAADAGHRRSLQNQAMFVHLKGNRHTATRIQSSRVSLQVQHTPQRRTGTRCCRTLLHKRAFTTLSLAL